ncbi:MAG: TIGR04282 family arsenosugar biosynthesis glycosyltransferase [Deltaproteobacteria bacterium]|nr:TIGR04282 family arsenosugar biosynthesis glycosyltransferase [Deltaproteobacteria bacterium]
MDERAGIIAVFAKPPRPGEVKTRLAATIGGNAAAALARAFFDDVWEGVGRLPGARRVLASTSPNLEDFGLGDAEVWLQGEGDLGARMEQIARRALEVAPWVLAVGADSPGLPLAALESAKAALLRSDAVLGPASDGGYYLLGLRRLEPGLLIELPWSTPATLSATAARLIERGLSVTTIEEWFDVDDAQGLARLRAELARGTLCAPRTAAALASLKLG